MTLNFFMPTFFFFLLRSSFRSFSRKSSFSLSDSTFIYFFGLSNPSNSLQVLCLGFTQAYFFVIFFFSVASSLVTIMQKNKIKQYRLLMVLYDVKGDIQIRFMESNRHSYKVLGLEPADGVSVHNVSAMASTYTLFADQAVCQALKIQNQGYRLMTANSNSNQPQLVAIHRFNNIEQNALKSPLTLLKKLSLKSQYEQIFIQRINLGLNKVPINGRNIVVPKLPIATEIQIFLNTNSTFDKIITAVVAESPFIVAGGAAQTLYINVEKINHLLHTQADNISVLLRRAVAENRRGKYTSYLRIRLKAFGDNATSCSANRLHYVYLPTSTKITIARAEHHECVPVVKMINLPELYKQIFTNFPCYQKLASKLKYYIVEEKPNAKMIILKNGSKGLGISSLLHSLSESNDYEYIRVNCKYFVNEAELMAKISEIQNYSSSIIYVKNIEWMLELTDPSQSDQKQKMKRLLQKLESAFERISDRSLDSHILVVSYTQSNAVKADMVKKADIEKFEPSQTERGEMITAVFRYYEKIRKYGLSNPEEEEEIRAMVANGIGWARFAKIMEKCQSTMQQKNSSNQNVKSLIVNEVSRIAQVEKVQNIKNVTWDDVGGLESAKEEIIQTILLPTKHPEIFDEWIKPRTGLLFYGPPGTGKTMLGKCIANQCKMGFISVKGPELLNMYIGESEKNVREVFERAAASKPCIIFMDELDALIPKRGKSSDSNQVMDRIVSELLMQMDKAAGNGIFVIGATNRPDLLDPSILRPGRFDKQIYLGIPKQKQSRISILKAQTRNLKLSQNLSYQKIIEATPLNFTGADFYGLTSRSIMRAAERVIQKIEQGEGESDEVILSEEDFIETVKKMKPSVSLQQLDHYEKLKQQYK